MEAKARQRHESTSLALQRHRHVVADLIGRLSRLNPFTPDIHAAHTRSFPAYTQAQAPNLDLDKPLVAMQVPAKQKYPRIASNSLPDQYARHQDEDAEPLLFLLAYKYLSGAHQQTPLWLCGLARALLLVVEGHMCLADALLLACEQLATGDDMSHPWQTRPRSHARSPLFVPILTTFYLHTHTYAQVRRP